MGSAFISAVGDALETMGTDITNVMGGILPGILVIAGGVATVTIGFKLFKKFTNKAGG